MSASTSTIRIGSTTLPYCRRQADVIARQLEAAWPDIEVAVATVGTRADRHPADAHPTAPQGESFHKELEAALREDRIDLAVHSHSDLPLEESPEFVIGAVPPRSDARDVLISDDGSTLADLPANPRIGAAGLCRLAQIRLARPDARPIPLCGEFKAQLEKLGAGEFHAMILPLCDLQALGLADRPKNLLGYDIMMPAPGQGAIAVQCRAGDKKSLALASALHHPESWATVTAERAFLRELDAGGDPPVGAYAEVSGFNLRLTGLIVPDRGSRPIRVSMRGLFYDPAAVGETLAQKALALGADKLLEA